VSGQAVRLPPRERLCTLLLGVAAFVALVVHTYALFRF
jgi:hypothetical protein